MNSPAYREEQQVLLAMLAHQVGVSDGVIAGEAVVGEAADMSPPGRPTAR